MKELFIYLIKVAAITSLFYACYQLFLKRDTFFKANRHFLLAGLVSAIALPFLVFTKVTYIERPVVEASTVLMTNANFQTATIPVQTESEINWLAVLAVVYVIGVLVMMSRFLLQLLALRRLTKNKKTVKNGRFKLVMVDDEIAPFSFFKTIVYNPDLYSKDELDAIIEHEQVHCRQLHSLDMVLSEVFLAFQWFNPFVWLYKRSIQQNLEFIADKEALETLNASKIYQQILLKVSLGNYCTAVVNNFFNSLIKKRIIMINQQSSHKRNLFKMAFILPLLALFLYSFNVKEETKFKPSVNETSAVSFISPIAKSDLQNISSGFGMHKSPFTKKQEFHNGIDLVAIRGTKVFAAESGTISLAKKDGKHGNRIIINHKGSYQTRYSHLLKFNVISGDQVNKGDVIAYVGSTGLSTGPHLHFEVLKDDELLDPILVVPTFNKVVKADHYFITRASTAQEISAIEAAFNKSNKQVTITLNPQFDATSRLLKKVTLVPLFSSESKSDTKVIVDFNKSKKFSFFYDKEQNGIVTKNGDESGFLILPDRFMIPDLYKNQSQEKEEKMGKNPLIILNGKVTDLKDTKNEELHILGELKMIKPSSAIKKYGKDAKDGAYEVKGEIKVVPKSGFQVKITKNMSDVQLEELKKELKDKHGYKLTFDNVKRNDKGHITSISIKMKGEKGVVSSSESNPLGIKDIHLGINEEGSIYMKSEKEDEVEIKIQGSVIQEKEVEIEEENEEKEEEIEVNEESEWKVSSGMVIKEVEYDDEKEVAQPYQIKTAAISKLKYEDGVDTEKYEFVFVVGKNSSDTYLNDMVKELKTTFNIGMKISKLKRNSNNEITSIRITLNDNKGNKSSATFKKGNNPIPNIAVGKENGNLIVRSISDTHKPDTDYLYPSGQSFKVEPGLTPLHVLNGEIISEEDFAKLDYNNIESVNVLKGKAAKKLYGEKGKNGVVVVITKKK
ncbi:M23/M56 family metallopeptidase [Spongiivirga citrea]|uniref:Peptidoglycan DD-metalloendopeptidase family protein n=1 Tax=Spongiivirga citrea TaxID=1481457 RepID=A0A6M0CD67_9FLAO|nr:M23/M56 family metallopeptidase [Spongiivirga citrea]NER15778.1 peptidoglycan DD-metalloendopeptidase family protein [Spongiivirga citrea]